MPFHVHPNGACVPPAGDLLRRIDRMRLPEPPRAYLFVGAPDPVPSRIRRAGGFVGE